MTLQNRVLPTGEIVADPARGTLTGNRGILHRPDRTLGTARWRHPHWISCALVHKDWHREVMSPGTWTELFFLDEAVAMAAGHRPCATCRREAHLRFRTAWAAATGAPASAARIDRILHASRLVPGTRRHATHEAPAGTLPSGTFISQDGTCLLLLADRAHAFRSDAYGPPRPRPEGTVTVLTPAPLVAVLRVGYLPLIHPSARTETVPATGGDRRP